MQTEQFWNQFITHNPTYKHHSYTAWQFGVDPTELAQLVRQGIKTATTSALIFYDNEQEPLPKVGDLSIVLDGDNQPVCIIENTKVYQTPFHQITPDHAYKEGEGDRTLDYWRTVHINFFEPEFKSIHRPFTEDEIMVCEEFKCLYTK